MILTNVKSCTAALLILAGTAFLTNAHAAPRRLPVNSIPGEVIVKFKPGASDTDIAHGLKLGRLKPKRHLQTPSTRQRGDNGITLAETDGAVEEVIARLEKHPAIEYLEPNLRYKHHATSNDPYIGAGYLWGLYGANGSRTNIFGSGALEAWNAGHVGTNTVVVAVIDEGIDIAHPDLAANIWKNPHDPLDGRDNDGNGYVDDVNGWDFAADTNVVFDPAGDEHGTHVAGTIGAKGGNGFGIAGVNWDVTIIPGKFLGAEGGNTFDAVEAIDYLVALKKQHGINLVAINASWGGSGYSRALHDAVIRAAKADILFIAAAGNDALDNDASASYPANLDTSKGTFSESAASYDAVISVAAIDKNGALATFSNYGAANVDLAAPGVEILSALPNGYLGYMDGTSMATPHVTGAAALYASIYPGSRAQTIRGALLGAATATPSLAARCATAGRLNIRGMIPSAPAIPGGLSAVPSIGSIALSWNVVSGAASYVIKRAATSAGPYSTLANLLTSTTYTDAAVVHGATYYYVVAAVNATGTSADSTPVFASPKPPANAAVMVKSDSATGGSWRGTYGREGQLAPYSGDFVLPTNVQISAYYNYAVVWQNPSTDLRALQKRTSAARFATRWNNSGDIYFFLKFRDSASHRVSFYFCDFDRLGRQQKIEIFDHTTGQLLGSSTIANFQSGVYSTWDLAGNVRIRLSRATSATTVLGGIFFDAPPDNVNAVRFIGADTTTGGTWKGSLGTQGHQLASDSANLPPYAAVSFSGKTDHVWDWSTDDPAALQKAGALDRIASCWYAPATFDIRINLTDGQTHKVAFYALDWDMVNRSVRVDVLDAGIGKILHTTNLSAFQWGTYLNYDIKGSLIFRFTNTSTANAVVSGIFFDAPGAPL